MNTVTATHDNVTLPSAPAMGYPATALGALQKACGWLFMTRRYFNSLYGDDTARRAAARLEELQAHIRMAEISAVVERREEKHRAELRKAVAESRRMYVRRSGEVEAAT